MIFIFFTYLKLKNLFKKDYVIAFVFFCPCVFSYINVSLLIVYYAGWFDPRFPTIQVCYYVYKSIYEYLNNYIQIISQNFP